VLERMRPGADRRARPPRRGSLAAGGGLLGGRRGVMREWDGRTWGNRSARRVGSWWSLGYHRATGHARAGEGGRQISRPAPKRGGRRLRYGSARGSPAKQVRRRVKRGKVSGSRESCEPLTKATGSGR
jgi:hypothetical protein